MTLEIWVAIAGGILIPLLLYLLSLENRSKKKYFLMKFQENKSKIEKFIKDLEHLLNVNNSFQSKAFTDSEITYIECLTLMKSRFHLEYSDEQYKALQKRRLKKLELNEYIEKLKVQEDNLNILRVDLDYKMMKYT
ncbi:hypothetical protein EV198_0471 [Roseivirga ehrenbergii]|uniref:Uncharacterized protein n=1 Tax=Roseivirga ehrenbergii (strain DSM 102268 / JCM 13514 / KCTC 12282 / NCIMB 14502 / KMM 6017) TaxID=279360 RepID=A0A150X8E1_ROSEK|nr:hypothetical protein [Roseivirga ehrenbergii]KYG75007.1 hypothetical protein MB14_07345 [Roseivirga ehrenbergii]TCL13641.1 hypothetical protein EV198_0471 [Roseivirga ehrenbergii]